MAIDRQGLSDGKDVRRLAEKLERDLLLNYRKQFETTTSQLTLVQDIDWDRWRETQIRKLPQFRNENRKIINKHAKEIVKSALKDFDKSYKHGIRLVERQIAKANKRGVKIDVKGSTPTFTKNERAIIKAKELQGHIQSASKVAENTLETQFYKAIRQTEHSPKGMRFLEALDVANKDLMDSGITGKISSNNRKINIANHIEMATVETSQEVMFIGEATKSEDANLFFVYITQHRSSCQLCTPFQAKVLIDDVYQNGVPDGKHMLLSEAIKAGLFHYGCRCNRVTYIPGIDIIPKSEKDALKGMSKRDQHTLYKAEQQQRYNERQIRKWKRTGEMSQDPNRIEQARLKVKEYQARNRKLVKETDGLYRNYWRENPEFKVPSDTRWGDLKHEKKIFDDTVAKDKESEYNINRDKKVPRGDPMPEKRFLKEKKNFEKIGGTIAQGEDIERHLDKHDANASTLDGYTIVLRESPTASELYEELIHARQYREGLIDGTKKGFITAELEAANELVKNRRYYGITDYENEINKERKEYFKELLRELEKEDD